jgi:murein DD-endopeptidase MepM/ murein hydrolase activator NlpD
MRKGTYYYNPNTLSYEPVVDSWKQKIWRVIAFLTTTFFFAVVLVTLGYSFITPPSQVKTEEMIKELENNYLLLDKRIEVLNKVIQELEDRDDNVYRVIFEAQPLPDELRRGSQENQQRFRQLSKMSRAAIISSTSEKLKALERQIYVQSKSYDQLEQLVKNKEQLLQAIPAIQPISNKQLKRVASGFGMRIDPIYKTPKMHAGLDFTAPIGTEIYATGNGTVIKAGAESDGYGLKVVIDHGYGYQTLYAHCSKILVRRGQKVKRGEKIALLGSTGKSTGPHLHYEVIRRGVKIDPINFFFNDLSPADYDRMIKLSQQSNQSFD